MAKAKRKGQGEVKEVHLTIAPPNILTASFRIKGTAPLVMNKFSQKAKQGMKRTQEAGSTGKKGKKREGKDFKAMYEGSKHISTQGWCGIPASAFRSAMVSACKLCGYAMTRAKLSIFIEADGFDADDHSPLVKITKGKPKYFESVVRIQGTTCDIHARALWEPGWEAVVRISYDADQFTLSDVANLLSRVGKQNGILEGRPVSKTSAGCGWGLFDVCNKK